MVMMKMEGVKEFRQRLEGREGKEMDSSLELPKDM